MSRRVSGREGSDNKVQGQLKAQGISNCLLTGNSGLRSRRKRAGGGVDIALIDWSAGFFGVRSPVRSALTASARQAHPNMRLLIIGDAPFDGRAAKAASIPFLADCTGKYDPSAFEGSNAVVTLCSISSVALAQQQLSLRSQAALPKSANTNSRPRPLSLHERGPSSSRV